MGHQPILEKISEYEKGLQKAATIRVQAETRLESLEEQYNETNRELEKLGVNPKASAEAYKALEKEIDNDLRELEKLIPFDIINQYK